MGGIAPSFGIVRFGVFEVDLRAGELRKQGLKIKLQEKPFQILALLLQHPGEVVTREELRNKLWPADTFVDFDRNLNTAINKLREALGDSADNPRFIETVPRRGYRFIVPVAVPGRVSPAAGKVMLAVLPFENLGGDPDQEYFSDGLTEEMITQLGCLQPRRLGVIARTTAMRYKGTDKSIDQIGRELGVDYILEGAVRRAADRVRVTAQLVQVSDQTHLWAESYDRKVAEIFAVQKDVAHRIANSLAVELLPAQRAALTRSPTASPLAYEAYLKGLYNWNKFTEDRSSKAIVHFEQAIKEDPSYAPAYAGLALCNAQLGGFFSSLPAKETFPRAKAAALKALEIDDALSEAHGSLGICKLFYDWDWVAAEKQFVRALELNPSYALAHHEYALHLMAMARLEEALAEEKQALQVDPLSLLFNAVLAWVLYFARQFDRAIEQCRKTLELDPNFPMAHWHLGRAYEQKGMFEEAILALQKAVTLSSTSPVCVAELGRAYAVAGQRGEAVKMLDELRELSKRQFVSSYFIGSIYAGLGETQQAFEWLQRAFDERSFWLIFLNVEPTFDSLRSERRFRNLLRRVGLPA